MPSLQRQTIHFGYAHIFALSTFTKSDFRLLEERLEAREIFTESNSWNGSEGILHCYTNTAPTESERDRFLIKVIRVGEVVNATRDALFALSVIFEKDGDHNNLYRISEIANSILISDFHASSAIVSKEATLRFLIGPLPDLHSFKFIWEGIVGKKEEDLQKFGTPVVGGGLRVVGTSRFPITDSFIEQAERDFRFESFLLDPSYLFVESTYRWQIVAPYQNPESLIQSIAPVIRQIELETHTSANAIVGSEGAE